ncbi:hypothetical protein V6N13_083861 [Hibiscus sabdariffa]
MDFKWTLIFVVILFSLEPLSANVNRVNDTSIARNIHVGLILDMQSLVGKVVDSCISMAISDFYSRNRYRTKLVLHTRDSGGDPLIVLSQALALLGSVKLDVIIVAENSKRVKILAGIGSRVKIPIITLFAAAPSLSFSEHPYLIRIGEDESSQAKVIATVVEAFSWRSVVLIYEDSDSAREILPILITSFEETGARIALHIALLASSTDGKIIEQLKMLMNMHTSVYVVHAYVTDSRIPAFLECQTA